MQVYLVKKLQSLGVLQGEVEAKEVFGQDESEMSERMALERLRLEFELKKLKIEADREKEKLKIEAKKVETSARLGEAR